MEPADFLRAPIRCVQPFAVAKEPLFAYMLGLAKQHLASGDSVMRVADAWLGSDARTKKQRGNMDGAA